MDNNKFQYEAIKWLFELELLDHPQLINNLKLNILSVSGRIKEVELLIYREKKAMLVLLELSWLGRKFYKKEIMANVSDLLGQMLPSFRFRITDDPEIMRLATEQVKKALSGGTYEKSNNPSNKLNIDSSNESNEKTTNVSEDETTTDLQSNSKQS